MLRKHSRLLFLVTPLLLPVASHAQSSPELKLILDRLERLETENRNLAAEVRALRTELSGTRQGGETQAAAGPAAAPSTAADGRC